MEVKTKPIVGYTHKITEAGTTWLALIGTNTKFDGYKVAYVGIGDLPTQITKSLQIINAFRISLNARLIACRYEGKVIE